MNYTTRQVNEESAVQHRTVRVATLFVVFACIALLALNLGFAVRYKFQKIHQADIANNNLARAVAQQMDSMVSEVGNILASIVYDLERHEVDRTTIDRMQPDLVNRVGVTQHLHDLFVYDARGNWLVSSQSATPASESNSDREYFVFHRGNPGVSAHVGKPILSRSSGTWVLPVSRRFNDSHGRFAGVVLATISMSYLKDVISEFDVGKEGALGLFFDDGTIVIRRPFSIEDVGRSSVGTDLYLLMTRHRFGSGEIISPFDGIERLMSYRHLKDHPLIVAVAVSKHEILEEWRATTFIQTGWIVALCIVIGLAGAHVVRSVRERLEVELSLGRTRDELTQTNAQLARLVRHDSLTTLANRRYFDEMLPQAFAEARRSRFSLALVMIDVDHFKRYNDLYGHPEGDRCLRRVALAVQSAARRPRDFVARYGGEEMVMVLPDTDARGAAFVAEAARKAVARLQIPHSGSSVGQVSISAGVAVHLHVQSACTAQDLLRTADHALYGAKDAGRNTVMIVDTDHAAH